MFELATTNGQDQEVSFGFTPNTLELATNAVRRFSAPCVVAITSEDSFLEWLLAQKHTLGRLEALETLKPGQARRLAATKQDLAEVLSSLREWDCPLTGIPESLLRLLE